MIYTEDVQRLSAFYERLGFERHFELPPDEPGYIGLRRGTYEIAVVDAGWPREQIGVEMGAGPRFELYAYVDDLDRTVAALGQSGTAVLQQPQDMPWGERIAYVEDPDGNPVALAASS